MDRLIRKLQRRLSLMIGRAVIRAARADGGRVLVTLDMLDGETSGEVEWAEPWGLTSIPRAGSEAVTLAVMGERANKVAIPMGDRSVRPRDLKPGDSALFDHRAQQIRIVPGGIEITTPLKLSVNAPVIEVTAGSATINGDAIATVTDLVRVGGDSSAGDWPIVTGVGDDG